MGYRVTIGDRDISVTPRSNGRARLVTLNGRELHVDWRAIGASDGVSHGEHATQVSALIGERSYEAYVRRVRNDGEGSEGSATFEVMIHGQPFTVTVQDERTYALAKLTGAGRGSSDATIRAPMPGLVSNVMVEEGATVERGQALVVLEAMKMENDLSTPRAGVVKSIRVTKGQTVNQGEALVVVGNPAGEESEEQDDTST